MRENKHIRILNRAQYWTNKIEDCPLTKPGINKSNRYLRHIRRLNRLSIEIENKELRNRK